MKKVISIKIIIIIVIIIIKSGNHDTLDLSIDDRKWFAAKVIKENCRK